MSVKQQRTLRACLYLHYYYLITTKVILNYQCWLMATKAGIKGMSGIPGGILKGLRPNSMLYNVKHSWLYKTNCSSSD